MRAMVLHSQAPILSAPLRPAVLPPPEPGPGEIRVRVRACATCRTDLHVVEGDLAPRRLPVIPGHQAVGEVEALGPDTSRFRRGDRVGIAWLRSTCGACAFCTTNRENLCEGAGYTGWTHDGGYAEACCVPEGFAYAMPAALADVDAAPLLCAGIIGYRALARSEVAPGGTLALYGFGSSAHLTLQVARHRGCAVFVCTREAAGRRLALALGAVWAGAPGERLPAPVSAAIIFAPAGALVPVALRDLERGGTLALAGIHMSDLPGMPYEGSLAGERTVRSVFANTRADGEAFLAEAATIPLRAEVSRHPLTDANRVLADLRGGRVRGTAVLVID